MKKVQEWLQENLAILLGVCAGVALIEVSPPQAFPWTLFHILCPPTPACTDILGGEWCTDFSRCGDLSPSC